VGFDVKDQLLSLAFVRYGRKKLEYNGTVHQLFLNFRKNLFYNIVIEFEVPMKPVRLIIMCLNETDSKEQEN
jgi:hypothetical protein